MSSKNQFGFSTVEIVIAVVVLFVLGLVSYVVYDKQKDKSASTQSSQQAASDQPTTANDVKSAPEINSTADLDKAQTVLDETDPGTSSAADTNQLDAELAEF